MSNWCFGIVVVVLIGKPPLMGEVLCSTENSPFLIFDHIHAKINRVCCAALPIGKKCMNVRKNKIYQFNKMKALISCAVTVQLICTIVFAYAKSSFSHDAAPYSSRMSNRADPD